MMTLSGKVGKFGKRGIAVISIMTIPMVMGMTKDPVGKNGSGVVVPEALLPAGSTSDGQVTASVTYTLGFTPYSFDPAGNDGEETLCITGGGGVTPDTVVVTASVSGGAVGGGWTAPAEGNPSSHVGSVTTAAMTAKFVVSVGAGRWGHFNGTNVSATAEALGKIDTAKNKVADNGE